MSNKDEANDEPVLFKQAGQPTLLAMCEFVADKCGQENTPEIMFLTIEALEVIWANSSLKGV